MLVYTCLVSGWAWSMRAWPDASVRSIMGWWPAISASSLRCFLCRDCAWCRFCPSFSDAARGRCSLIHCCCASSSNTNLWNRSDSSSAARRLWAGSRSALNLQSFNIRARIKNTVTPPTQASHRFNTFNTLVQGSQTYNPLTDRTPTTQYRITIECTILTVFWRWHEGVPFLDGNAHHILEEGASNA